MQWYMFIWLKWQKQERIRNINHFIFEGKKIPVNNYYLFFLDADEISLNQWSAMKTCLRQQQPVWLPQSSCFCLYMGNSRCPLKVVWWFPLSYTAVLTIRRTDTTSPTSSNSVAALEALIKPSPCLYAKKTYSEFLTNQPPDSSPPLNEATVHSKWYAPLSGAVNRPVGWLFLSF